MNRAPMIVAAMALLVGCEELRVTDEPPRARNGGEPAEAKADDTKAPEPRESPRGSGGEATEAADLAFISYDGAAGPSLGSGLIRGSASGGAPAPPASQQSSAAGFAGYFELGNWRALVDGVQAPVGAEPDGGTVPLTELVDVELARELDLLIDIAADGKLGFDWFFESMAEDVEAFGYVLNDEFILLSDGAIKNGSVLIDVKLGDVFGFAVRSEDPAIGPANAEISNFFGPNPHSAIPEPASATTVLLLSLVLLTRRGAKGVR